MAGWRLQAILAPIAGNIRVSIRDALIIFYK